MTAVHLPFNGQRLTFDVPERNLAAVMHPAPTRPLADLDAAIAKALNAPMGQPPLAEGVRPSDKILIVSDDNTRLTPVDRLLPPLVEKLNNAGVPDGNIQVIMALGTHRAMTAAEMRAKVGEAIFSRLTVFNHDWRDPEVLVDLGVSKNGTPLEVNRAAVEADVVIGIGAIVPHHIPGFSGASKIIQPGICGARTTAETHLLSTRHDDSLLGLVENPVRQDLDDIADRVGMKTIFNVVMDAGGRVVGLFFGEMRTAFRGGAALAREIYGIPYREPADIVIANSCPADLDFWQSHKSLYPAARMVKPGGTIIVTTPCPEGVSPVHTSLLDFTAWPSAEIETAYRRGEIKSGVAAALAVAWAKVREKAPVILVSPGIPDQDARRLGFTPAADITAALDEAFQRQGPDARVSVLTHAPDTLPLPVES
jgi:nickel-dependent lactate racemase